MIILHEVSRPYDPVLRELKRSSYLEVLRKGTSVLDVQRGFSRELGFPLCVSPGPLTLESAELTIIFPTSLYFPLEDLRIMAGKLTLSSGSLVWTDGSQRMIALGIKGEELKLLKHNPDAILQNLFAHRDLQKHLGSAITLEAPAHLNLETFDGLISFLHADFQLRHFNSLTAEKNWIRKSSRDKKKMKAEYSFFHLVPEEMKPYFAPTFSFVESSDSASYQMEKFSVLDVATQWIHGSFTAEEFRHLLDRLFTYFVERPRKSVPTGEREKNFDENYIHKVEARRKELSLTPLWKELNKVLDLERIFSLYFGEIEKARAELLAKSPDLTLLHGDLCFSNILFAREVDLLKFIDPRGATSSDEIWGDTLYDIVKLSHSILGDYDLINNHMAQPKFSEELKVDIHFDAPARTELKDLFLEKVHKTFGISSNHLRLLEASLFLSMLPLHSDHPKKVLMFALRGASILEDVSQRRL